MENKTTRKTAYVGKDSSGYWVACAYDTGKNIGGLHSTELDAFKAANAAGYIVIGWDSTH
jgi:hypothetical protein